MNRSELVEIVAERAGSDRAVARRHVDAVFEVIIDGVSSGDRVLVTGFGTFDRFERAARVARNPRTGQPVEIAAGTVPRFRFGQTFKNRVARTPDGAVPAPRAAETAAAEVAQAPAVTEVVPEKKAKKPKKDKKATSAKSPVKASGKKAAKKPAGKPAKKGSGKKTAKAR